MTINEIRNLRVSIVLEALKEGLSIPYKRGWYIHQKGDTLYQTTFSQHLERDITHKCSLTLNDFLEFVYTMSDEELKMIHGSITLIRFQRNLMDNFRDDYIDPLDHEQSK